MLDRRFKIWEGKTKQKWTLLEQGAHGLSNSNFITAVFYRDGCVGFNVL